MENFMSHPMTDAHAIAARLSEEVPQCRSCGGPSPWGDPCGLCDAPLFDLAEYSLAVRLKLARQDQSYRQAAPDVGVSPATLHRIARGRGVPDVESYLRVNRWLAVRRALQEQDR